MTVVKTTVKTTAVVDAGSKQETNKVTAALARRRFIAPLHTACLFLLTVLFAANTAALSLELEKERRAYTDALDAIKNEKWQQYQQLRPTLDTYPLAIYLDYYQLRRQAHRAQPEDINRFVLRSGDSPLPNRLLTVYLRNAGKQRRWQDFLEVMPHVPRSTDLQCYYYRARLAEGATSMAFLGAEKLWLHGKSQPKACDPLFKAWQDAGRLTDDLVWQRQLLAYSAKQGVLLKYLHSKGSAKLRPWSTKLQAVYRKPDNLSAQHLPTASARSAELSSVALQRLARYSPAKALAQYQVRSKDLDFLPEQQHEIEYDIARQSLFARTKSHEKWLQGALARLQDDELVEIRLRWLLPDQDWYAIEDTLALLSPEGQDKGVWRYWQAISLERRGDAASASIILKELANERGYYSFLAADRLDQTYNFNHQSLTRSTVDTVSQLAALRRIEELHFHDEVDLAYSEWFKVLQDTPDAQEKQQLAMLAADQGWHRLSIDAANKAEAWDALDLRFPTPYRTVFTQYAAQYKLPPSELMAIARRESAFFPTARSSAGARGLMQIMPATGKQVASSIGQKHRNADLYKVDHNVLLGSTYYRQLLDRFNGNRIFAFTAYNAGPHRVDRWRKKSAQQLPMDIWVETIPYRETRNYVQAVLSYNVVFRYLMGDTHSLLTPLERSTRY